MKNLTPIKTLSYIKVIVKSFERNCNYRGRNPSNGNKHADYFRTWPTLPAAVAGMRHVCDFGYSPINGQYLELLYTDLELLAVMQLIAFRIRGQEENTCQ